MEVLNSKSISKTNYLWHPCSVKTTVHKISSSGPDAMDTRGPINVSLYINSFFPYAWIVSGKGGRNGDNMGNCVLILLGFWLTYLMAWRL